MASFISSFNTGIAKPAAKVGVANSNVFHQAVVSKPLHLGRTIVCQATRDEQSGAMSRRAAAAVFSVLLSASPAKALIPDDDDEELIEKAKANRKQRIAEQKETAKEFSKTEGFNQEELVCVQRAINKLARSAAELEAGNLPAVVAVVQDGWKSEFEKATASLSTTDQAKTSATALLNGLALYEQSALQGSSDEAKRSFVETVSAFQDWAKEAGIAASIKGL